VHFILRGATVVDGSGAPARRADVEVHDGRIGAIGDLGKVPGATDVDVSGLVLAPGFVDLHTHFDSQVFWDGDLTPSPWHGVTTAIQGNCGFGIAPTHPADREAVMEMLGLVEGMELRTLQQGIDWRFETFPQYLDVIRSLPKRINLGAMLPHSVMRVYVMGVEAAYSRAATDDERARIKAIVREAMHAGAMGVSTSQAPAHLGPAGRPVPSRWADQAEIRAMVEVLAEVGRGIAEITFGKLFQIDEAAALSKEYGVPITWGAVTAGSAGLPGAGLEQLQLGKSVGADEFWPQTSCRFPGTHMSMANPYSFGQLPSFSEVIGAPRDVQKKIYRDPAWRDKVKNELATIKPGFGAGALRPGYFNREVVAETTKHVALKGRPLTQLADERGMHPFDLMVDLALEEDLETRFGALPWEEVFDEFAVVLRDPRTVLGGHDAGAHLDMLCDSCFPTWLLSYWVREKGVLSVEEAIWKLSGQAASAFRVPERGFIRQGLVADLVAFDMDTVAPAEFERRYDFPGNADRLTAQSIGIEHVWVAGTAIRTDGKDLDGVRPGQLVSPV
jgi:N-acyl-D-aspartate/D-glutamate deacylase